MNAIPSRDEQPARSYAPYWLALGPVLVVIASFITLYLVWRHPDQPIAVEQVSEIHDASGTHVHVTNSVTPPLK